MKFGLTQEFACSYLDDKQERLLVYIDDSESDPLGDYERLIAAGFRRSGDQVYRPHCENCNACQSVRIPVALFSPSKSQKRVLAKNSDISCLSSQQDKPQYYDLYQRYITARHRDGSMFPADRQQYNSFVNSDWMSAQFLEMYQHEQLIAVAVTDRLAHGLSAMYTFFEPQLASRSIGTFAILQQIDLARQLGLPYLYLGYQVDECAKMRYKAHFLPHERFFCNKWQLFTKKTP